jgi:hypothetical protein
MSGGSHDYAFTHVASMADILKRSPRSDRRAFGLHLERVAQAMHDVEWVDSDDYAPDGDVLSIKACLSEEMIMDVLYRNALNAKEELERALKEFMDYREQRTNCISSSDALSVFQNKS